ncbi:hypothetical protein SynMITS9220_01748 [Synechococcus sp. MIT S9220]|nr:hypothetical protein SynMITS9220_01748 [Synechococcus sp. MIT S9220]
MEILPKMVNRKTSTPALYVLPLARLSSVDWFMASGFY